MNREFQKKIADQLRKPEGEMALDVASAMNVSNRQMNEFTITSLNLKNFDSILEVGMGNGFFVQKLFDRENSIQYTGMDYSAVMVKTALKQNRSLVNSGKATFVEGDAENMPFKDNTFDHIFTVNTIYFWKEPSKVLNEMSRILKEKAQLSIAIRTKEKMQNFPFTKFGFRLYREDEILYLLDSNRWKILKSQTYKEDDYILEEKKIPLETFIVTATPE